MGLVCKFTFYCTDLIDQGAVGAFAKSWGLFLSETVGGYVIEALVSMSLRFGSLLSGLGAF